MINVLVLKMMRYVRTFETAAGPHLDYFLDK